MTAGQGKQKTPRFSMLDSPLPSDTQGQVSPSSHFSAVDAKVLIGLQQRVTNDTGPLEISKNFIHGLTCFNKCRFWQFSAFSIPKITKDKLKVLGCSANHVGGENTFDLRLSIGALINLLIWDAVH